MVYSNWLHRSRMSLSGYPIPFLKSVSISETKLSNATSFLDTVGNSSWLFTFLSVLTCFSVWINTILVAIQIDTKYVIYVLQVTCPGKNGRRTYFDNCVSQHLSGAGSSPAGSVGRDLNLLKLNYQYFITSVAVVLVVRWYFNGILVLFCFQFCVCRKRLSSPRCRSELIDSAWVVIVPGQNCIKNPKKLRRGKILLHLKIYFWHDCLRIYGIFHVCLCRQTHM